MASSLFKTLIRSSNFQSTAKNLCLVRSEIGNHTAKWMQVTSKKSPMELINEVPPIKVEGRIVACEGDSNPALGHPIEFICLDLNEPTVCKYYGLSYIQEHHARSAVTNFWRSCDISRVRVCRCTFHFSGRIVVRLYQL
ncbi:NADH dehydrogenase [ubiquinone] iron-sulfur protein 6, mitochondrial-like [Juglans regia]|uniref:NADH dehydrogenase [ubiquinone] iron-sulfur protein 6, mitochondrial-like n=1 Tax=Juglans regia TaxID=51240 RepID=A0A6P9DYV3_JUGRE|nr:NADH dehydrogenase [ubiquinone] iron-sulfur protein 6, mitochondrial-like [Juglans regia]